MSMPPEYDAPPPYYDPNLISTISTSQTEICEPTNLDSLSQLLGQNELFTFFPTGRLGFLRTRTVMVQIRDSCNHPVLSGMTAPGRISRGFNYNQHNQVHSTAQLGGSTTFSDISGRNLLHLLTNNKESDAATRSMTVISGGLLLGILEGKGFFRRTMIAKEAMGEHLFEIEGSKGGHNGCGCFDVTLEEFRILQNGVQIGKIAKGIDVRQPHLIGVSISNNLNIRTKSIVLAAAYDIFLNRMVGSRGWQKNFFLFVFLGFIVVFGLVIVIAIVTIFGQKKSHSHTLGRH